MRSRTLTDAPLPVHRISGPAEMLDAIPYLLGFHPADSVVLVGLTEFRLIVTARIDLAAIDGGAAAGPVLDSMAQGGAEDVVVVLYPGAATRSVEALADRLVAEVDASGCRFVDAIMVADGRWWGLTCDGGPCPPEGRPLEAASPFAAYATVEGMVALPDREAMSALLEPAPDEERRRLGPAIAAEERSAGRAAVEGTGDRRERSVKRALFAAARRCHGRPEEPIVDGEAVRLGVALSRRSVLDSIWHAVDDGRLDGRPLWRELGRRLPSPYDAPALLLYGWASWRAGEGTLAGMAADRARASDPDLTAADLLAAAVSSGVNPHVVPRLRRPK